MLINSSLDQLNISLGDNSFSNGNGQHAHCISEKGRRRQQKMHGAKKSVGRVFWMKIIVDFWVEMKKDGLKTGGKSGTLQY